MKISSLDIGLNDEKRSAPMISFGVEPFMTPPPSISYILFSIIFCPFLCGESRRAVVVKAYEVVAQKLFEFAFLFACHRIFLAEFHEPRAEKNPVFYLFEFHASTVLAEFHRVVSPVALAVELEVAAASRNPAFEVFEVSCSVDFRAPILNLEAAAVGVVSAARRHKGVYRAFKGGVVFVKSLPNRNVRFEIRSSEVYVKPAAFFDFCAGIYKGSANLFEFVQSLRTF